jgi:Flp pilus assembly protein TadG
MAKPFPAAAEPAPQAPARGGLRGAGAQLSRNEKGATTVEFALIAVPFFALLFAILETGMAFFAANVLETAVTNSARLIRTGQAQEEGLNLATFKQDVCDQLVLMFNCNSGLYVDVQKFDDFGDISLSPPIDEHGDLKKDGYTYEAGHGGDIIVVRAYYQWPVFVPQFGNNLADLGNGMHLLAAAAAFRNEPFPW